MARVDESGRASADGPRIRSRYAGGRSERRPYEEEGHGGAENPVPERAGE